MLEGLHPLLAALSRTRRIWLRGLALDCSIGIHDFERAARQRVHIDVDLYVAEPGNAADDIAHVVDYDFVREAAGRLAADRHFNLQETLAEEILALCLQRDGVLAVRVATSKPDVYPDCDAVGVDLFRAHPSFWTAGRPS